MSKRDYELIAKVIKECKSAYTSRTAVAIIEDVEAHLAVALKEQNPRFSSSLFLSACLPEEEGQ